MINVAEILFSFCLFHLITSFLKLQPMIECLSFESFSSICSQYSYFWIYVSQKSLKILFSTVRVTVFATFFFLLAHCLALLCVFLSIKLQNEVPASFIPVMFREVSGEMY